MNGFLRWSSVDWEKDVTKIVTSFLTAYMHYSFDLSREDNLWMFTALQILTTPFVKLHAECCRYIYASRHVKDVCILVPHDSFLIMTFLELVGWNSFSNVLWVLFERCLSIMLGAADVFLHWSFFPTAGCLCVLSMPNKCVCSKNTWRSINLNLLNDAGWLCDKACANAKRKIHLKKNPRHVSFQLVFYSSQIWNFTPWHQVQPVLVWLLLW